MEDKAAKTEATADRERQQVRQRLEQEWRIEERPFRSDAPLLGPIIVAIRTAWNNVATRWYVRPLFEQQQAYNQLLGNLASQQMQQIAELSQQIAELSQQVQQIAELRRDVERLQWQTDQQAELLGDRESSIAALAEQSARLEVRVLEIQDRLDAS